MWYRCEVFCESHSEIVVILKAEDEASALLTLFRAFRDTDPIVEVKLWEVEL